MKIAIRHVAACTIHMTLQHERKRKDNDREGVDITDMKRRIEVIIEENVKMIPSLSHLLDPHT